MKHIITNTSHSLVRDYFNKDDIIVDATCGNGNDTLFFATNAKHVYAFDIQENALANAKYLCAKRKNVTYILDSHENVFKYIDHAKGYCFNLGYLPNGDKSITTKKETTIKALREIFTRLRIDDFILITCYPHKEGKKESTEIDSLLSSIDQRNYDILKTTLEYKIKTPPYFYFIIRIR